MLKKEIKDFVLKTFNDVSVEVITKVIDKLKNENESFKNYSEIMVKDFVLRASYEYLEEMNKTTDNLSPLYGSHLTPMLSDFKGAKDDAIENLVNALAKEITFYIAVVMKDLKTVVNRTEKELELTETKVKTTSYLPRVKKVVLPTFDVVCEVMPTSNVEINGLNMNFAANVDVDKVLELAKLNYGAEVEYISSYPAYNEFKRAITDIYTTAGNGPYIQKWCSPNNGQLFAVVATFAKIAYKIQNDVKLAICQTNQHLYNNFMSLTTRLIFSKYSVVSSVFENNVIAGASTSLNTLYGVGINLAEAFENNGFVIEDIYGELIHNSLENQKGTITSCYSGNYSLVSNYFKPISLHTLRINKERNTKLYSEYRGFIIRDTNNNQRARTMNVYREIFMNTYQHSFDGKKFTISKQAVEEVILPYIRKQFVTNVYDAPAVVQSVFVDILYADTNFDRLYWYANELLETNTDDVKNVPVYSITRFVYDSLTAQLEQI